MRALKKLKMKDVLFIDIETSSIVPELQLDTPLFDSWAYKKGKETEDNNQLIEMFADQAALYSEFGRIVCISVGMLGKDGFKTTTFNNLDEKKMIEEFYDMLDKVEKMTGESTMLCGHAIKQFDIPYIAHRGIANNLTPHDLVDTSGLKPWELDWMIDTKDLWQGTGFNRASLLGIVTMLGLPSPKQDLQGKDVPKYFWLNPEENIGRISEYCERDVVAVYDVLNYLVNTGKKGNIPEKPKSLIEELFDGRSYGEEERATLKEYLTNMSGEERQDAYVVLESMTSTAKGKKTKITKTHIKALKKEIDG